MLEMTRRVEELEKNLEINKDRLALLKVTRLYVLNVLLKSKE